MKRIVVSVIGLLFTASAWAADAPAPAPTTPSAAPQAQPLPAPATPAAQISPAAAAPAVAQKKFIYVPKPYDVVIGKEKAPVTIVEYASLSCPHCAHFFNNILPTIEQKYIDTGKAKLVYRNYPLNKPALDAALLVNCAEKGQRHQFISVLFKLQNNWAYSPTYMDGLTNIALLGGLDKAKFDACMNDTAMQKEITEVEKEAADDFKINSTPTFFINGTIQQGVADADTMGKAIEQALAPAKP
jgi:protein-disulfide isomerase